MKNNFKYTTETFIQKAKTIHKDKFDYSKTIYNGCFNIVEIFCKKCNKPFWQTPAKHLFGHGCPNCTSRDNYYRFKMSEDVFFQRAKTIHDKKYNYDQTIYINYHTKIKIFCNKCKKYFWQTPAKHLSGQGCPRCCFSKKEIYIEIFLQKNNIKYEYQKRFSECKDKHVLPFDFYLPDYNICIEYQGEQHYKFRFFNRISKKFIKKIKRFLTVKKHDKIKKKFCQKNNITLIEIKYNENIDNKLNNILKIIGF